MSYHHSVQVPFCNITLLHCLKMRIIVNYIVSKLCQQQEVLFYPETVVKVVMNHNFISLHTAIQQ